ncbi:MAG: IS66 family transposase [Solirubrobacteraceae bacterium]
MARERDEYKKLYLSMLELNRKLELGLRGQKAEKLSPEDAQLTMAMLASMFAQPTAPAPVDDAAPNAEPDDAEAASDNETSDDSDNGKPRPKPGRKPLPEELPRVEIRILPPEVEREGLDQFEQIGQEVSEVVERRKASLVVVRVIRPKFVRKDRERNAETEVLAAEAPELPIERGMAGPGVLAETIVRRFDDHLPANRQERIWARDGMELARSTICDWHFRLHQLVTPLLIAMWKDALASPWLCTDATGVLVQAKDRCRTGHFWTVIAPERHVLYAYSARHDSAAVDALLEGYKGYLAADAHVVYDHLYRTGDVVEVSCWAHGRRYFYKALASDPDRARWAIALIKGLFDIEEKIAKAPSGKRRATRARESKPLVDRFFDWCVEQAPLVLDETPIARAIGYALNQRAGLERFLSDERLPLHNNASENALRRQRVGSHNWTFLGSDDGGQVNATFVSLLASCRLHEIEPSAYLRGLLCLLPSWPINRLLELAPIHWRETLQQEETQRRLDANIFRRVTLE